MQTANFGTGSRHPYAVAICRGVPRWYKGKRYEPLAPTREMLKKENLPHFDEHYEKILAQLDPKKVWADLRRLCELPKTIRELGDDDVVLLCWEPFNVRCHRRRVAEWLESKLGVTVAELKHHREESLKYGDMPRKGSAAAAKLLTASKTSKRKSKKAAPGTPSLW